LDSIPYDWFDVLLSIHPSITIAIAIASCPAGCGNRQQHFCAPLDTVRVPYYPNAVVGLWSETRSVVRNKSNQIKTTKTKQKQTAASKATKTTIRRTE